MISFSFFSLRSLSVYISWFLYVVDVPCARGRDLFLDTLTRPYFRYKFSSVFFHSNNFFRCRRCCCSFVRSFTVYARLIPMRCVNFVLRGGHGQAGDWMFGWAFTTAIWCLFFLILLLLLIRSLYVFAFYIPFDYIDFGFFSLLYT